MCLHKGQKADNVAVRRNSKVEEYGRPGFTKYGAVHWKKAMNEAEECVIVRLLESFFGQVIDEKVANGVKAVRAQNFWRG